MVRAHGGARGRWDARSRISDLARAIGSDSARQAMRGEGSARAQVECGKKGARDKTGARAGRWRGTRAARAA